MPAKVAGGAGLDIEALYEQYRVRMFRAIAGVVFDDAAAEDLTQETFERAWRSRSSYRGVTTRSAPGCTASQ